ncbi:hypothetical protein Tco_0498587, partial [Tanacetum coccineum]
MTIPSSECCFWNILFPYSKLVITRSQVVLTDAPTTLSFQKAPIDKVAMLQVQHQVSDRFKIPLVESEEDLASPQGIHQENLKLS